MFFNKKKKPKLDAKVRFQHQQFTKKLDQARQFKRAPRSVPDSRIDKWLMRLYLGTRWSQIGLGLLILGLVYVVYVPNFLSVQKISVQGVNDSDRLLIEGAIRQAIGDAPVYNPQHNILFLSRERIKTAALSTAAIYEVVDVKKQFKERSVSVSVRPKYFRYYIKDSGRVYLVYNDGTLYESRDISMTPEAIQQWESNTDSSIVKIAIGGTISSDNRQVLSNSLLEDFETALRTIQNITGSSLSHFLVEAVTAKSPLPTVATDIPGSDGSSIRNAPPQKSVDTVFVTPLSVDEFRAVFRKGGDGPQVFTVIFDAKSDLTKAAERLSLLLSQTPPDRYQSIDYVDMRLENRGYICLLNTPCAQ